MLNRDKTLAAIQRNYQLCDRCLMHSAGLTHHATGNQESRLLASRGLIGRSRGRCAACAKIRLLSSALPPQSH